jgi:pyruvate,orthophosphate dikinase
MAKPCVVGCAELEIDGGQRRAQLAGVLLKEGDWLSVDGESGAIYLGRRDVVIQRPDAELAEVARWRSKVA